MTDIDSSKRRTALRQLADDVGRFNSASEFGTMEDIEMLSLMVDEARRGVDIARRYPSYYHELLAHADLREAFLDLLQALEEDDTPVPGAEPFRPDLGFLAEHAPEPVVQSGAGGWRIYWERTVAYLESIFTPAELAYRADPSLSDDPWFTVLREEIDVDGLRYAVALDCTLSDETGSALAPYLNVAVTVDVPVRQPQFPIQSSLEWGAYQETVRITEEGPIRFPDIPLDLIFDKDRTRVTADLKLTLQPVP